VDIVTVTLNPAIDETIFLDRLVVGSVNRTRRHHRQAGGKGVNVSAMLGDYGIPSIATGFLGANNAKLFETHFESRGVRDEFIRVPGETRTGIKIIDDSTRETTDINFPGLRPGFVEVEAFERKLKQLVAPGRWFVLSGSLPAGISIDFFEEILALLKRGGARIAADTSGEALKLAVERGVDLVKPNEHELSELLGRPLPDFVSRLEAVVELHEKVPHVVLSLGGEGAFFLTPDTALMASAAPVKVVSTVGAGDSLLAGYLAGLATGLAPAECARLATVFAWAALEDIARRLPPRKEILERLPRIQVQPLSTLSR
jgi:1-phosphofructokinase